MILTTLSNRLGATTLLALITASATQSAPDKPSPVVQTEARSAAEGTPHRSLSEAESKQLRSLLSTADDKECLAQLRALRKTVAGHAALQRDIDALLPVVELWAEGREMAASGRVANPDEYLHASLGATTPPAIRKASPLYPLYCLYRGRNLVWTVVQNPSLRAAATGPEGHYTVARNLFTEAQALVPDNPIINMYLGRPIPWAAPQPDPQAPAWANSQRVILEHLNESVQFWTKERQLADGSFGGGSNADVELWRDWLAVTLAFENPGALRAQELLAGHVFKQPHLPQAAGAEALTSMLFLKPGSKDWGDRTLRLATDLKANGTTLDTRAIQPLLAHWHQSRDAALTPVITKWLDTWVDAAASERDGKPAGLLPAAITGRIGGTAGQWWKVEAFPAGDEWPSGVSDMLHALLIAYHVTGKETYLEPVRSMARIRADFLLRHAKKSADKKTNTEAQKSSAFEPGSLDWAADKLGSVMPGALDGYRRFTGDKQFDAVILHDAGDYGRWIVNQDMEALEASLARTAEALSFNRAAYTTEVRATDRAFDFTAAYLNAYAEPKLPVPDTRLAYSAASGEVGTSQGARFAAVRWLTPARNIAALVKTATPREVEALLYNFGQSPTQMGVETFLLAPGEYDLVVFNELGEEDSAFTIHADGTSNKTYFEIAVREIYTVRIKPAE